MAGKFGVTFDGYSITELLRVTSLNRGVGPSRSSITSKRNDKKGVHLLGTSSDELAHEMGFVLRYDLIHKRRELARILNVTEPKKLIYSDEPDKFYWAFPKGDTKVDEKVFLGFGTITWQIFDGVAYSADEYVFFNDGENPNVIEVNNPGTEPMLMELSAKFPTQCGFLGVQDTAGLTNVLFGSIEEVDGYNKPVSQLLFDDHLITDKGWLLNQGVVPPVTSNPLQTGSVEYVYDQWQKPPADPKEGFARVKSYGSGSEWHGPSLTKVVPADKNGKYPVNFKDTYRFDFNTSGTGDGSMVGHNSVTFSDATGKIICAIVVEDNNTAQERSDLAFYVGNERVWDTRNTQLFYTTQRPQQGNVMVERIGKNITFMINYANIKKTFVVQGTAAELRKITWYAAQYSTRKPMHNNLLRAMNLVKHNVDSWVDIPNKFTAGDKLVYGKSGDNIYVTINEMQGLQLRDPGSTLIYAKPGTTSMIIACSDFATMPEVTLTGRAMYV